MSNDIRIQLPTETRDRASWGVGDDCYRDCLVEPDGTVRVWDDVAGHYTIASSLTADEIAEAQRLAGLVRAGTHYEAAGFVSPIDTQRRTAQCIDDEACAAVVDSSAAVR